MPDRTKYALTQLQREHLQVLFSVEAFGRKTAISTYFDPKRLPKSGWNAGVAGILIDKGFAQKAVRSRSGQRMTVYWLTPTGYGVARDLVHAE
jgi:hypothetical protein